MALRKDKVAAALREMKGICSSPEDPASLPNTINQLADILGNLFDDIALPELPQIDSGEFGFPEDAPFDFPLGGGDMPFFDPLGGLEGGFPGGGEEFGPGGEGGGGEGFPPPPNCNDVATTEHVTFLGKTIEEIPASKNGIPGVGQVEEQQITEQGSPEQIAACKRECARQYQKDIEQLDDNITMYEDRLREGGISDQIIDSYNEEIRTLRKQKRELDEPYGECLENCKPEPEEGDEDAIHGTGTVLTVYNISCDKIEADKQVVVSGTIVKPRECGYEDLYVMVEACGCCDE